MMFTSSTQPLFFNSDFLYQKANQTNNSLITSETVEKVHQQLQTAIQKVNQNLNQHSYGFAEVLTDDSYLKEVKNVFAQLKGAKTMVVVGIGGSDLGSRAIQQALTSDQPPMEVIFHGDSTDPVQISRLLKKINLDETVFNIVSKSGQTVETTAQYLFFKNIYQQKYAGQSGRWATHFVFTTDPKEGLLRKEANQFEILTVPIPPNVGGRFSVLTPVGLLPALAMGVDIEQLTQGARDFFQQASSLEMSQAFAGSQYQLYLQGIKVVVMMPYAIQLEEFARWFRQLWAESLGKEGKGILPIQARGPADQHSQEQFYTQGVPMQSLLYLRINQRSENYELQSIDIPEASYLEGHSFGEIINIEQQASALSLKKQGRPSATLEIQELSAYTLGQLFAFFEMAVIYLAEMLEVNAFDQPGVEQSKQIIYARLGRAGFAEKKAELEDLK